MQFSIITINYNNRGGLRKTIESVVTQSFVDYEYIVIDGGSTDGSVDVIKQYADKVTFWISEPDKGIYNAMNKGIAHAHGKYLNFLNSGDCFHSSAVLADVNKIQKDEDILIGSCMNPETKRTYSVGHDTITLLHLLKNTINHQATFYKRSLFVNRLYDESYKIQSDCKFNFQSIIFDDCSVKVMDIIVADYDYNGFSAVNQDLVEEEWQKLLHELIPNRILLDYKNQFTSSEVPIVALLPQLKNSYGIQKCVYYFAYTLLKVSNLWKRKK